MTAPVPVDEAERLRVLDECKILDTPPEESFDRICRLAAEVFETPMAAVSFLADERQFFKGSLGLPVRETPRDVAFCAHAVLQDEPLVVLDARLDPRFKNNPFVTSEPSIRFYCGAPLRSEEGVRLGTVCVIDTKPWPAVPKKLLALLQEFAAQASDELTRRRQGHRLADQLSTLRESQRELVFEKRRRREIEVRAQVALEAGNMATWEFDASSGRLCPSPLLAQLFGISDSHLFTCRQWLKRLHPVDRKRLLHFARTPAKELETFVLELRVLSRPRQTRWLAVRGRLIRGPQQIVLGANGVCWDVTAQHVQQERLRASEEIFRGISIASPVGIYQADLGGSVSFANPRSQEIWGMDEKDLLGTGWTTRLHPEDAPSLMEAWTKANRLGQSFQQEYRLLFPDGSVRWINGRSSIVRDSAGSAIGTVGTVDDITDRKRFEQDQEHARRMAEQANEAKNLFLANVSHELRTPLNGVLGTAEILSTMSLGGEERELVQAIKQSGQALLVLVDDLLDLARTEAGKVECKCVPFELRRTLSQALALVSPVAREKGLPLKLHCGQDIPDTLLGDEDRIRQILINYLNNALKFTREGSVSVRVSQEVSESGAPQLVISVADTGCGISDEAQRRLFRPFQQVDDSSTRKHGGLGLGLAISARLAEAMGGAVGLESTAGQGSTFFLRLPLRVVENMYKADGEFRANPQALHPWRVLVAEDNAINQKVALRLLSNLGCSVDLAADGEAAVRLWKEKQYDVVLMDCQMPELDGYEATRRIRESEQSESRRRTPILALTAHAMKGDRERCLRSGMDDHLIKPLSLQALRKALEKWQQVAAVPVR